MPFLFEYILWEEASQLHNTNSDGEQYKALFIHHTRQVFLYSSTSYLCFFLSVFHFVHCRIVSFRCNFDFYSTGKLRTSEKNNNKNNNKNNIHVKYINQRMNMKENWKKKRREKLCIQPIFSHRTTLQFVPSQIKWYHVII